MVNITWTTDINDTSIILSLVGRTTLGRKGQIVSKVLYETNDIVSFYEWNTNEDNGLYHIELRLGSEVTWSNSFEYIRSYFYVVYIVLGMFGGLGVVCCGRCWYKAHDNSWCPTKKKRRDPHIAPDYEQDDSAYQWKIDFMNKGVPPAYRDTSTQ
jgi:hypothetical protein